MAMTASGSGHHFFSPTLFWKSLLEKRLARQQARERASVAQNALRDESLAQIQQEQDRFISEAVIFEEAGREVPSIILANIHRNEKNRIAVRSYFAH